MTKTNQYGQQTTDSGHVITESERIAEAINKLLDKNTFTDDKAYSEPLREDLLSDLTAYVMDYAHAEWSKNVRHGVRLGRRDAVVMLKAALDTADDKHNGFGKVVQADELKKVITALEETA